MNISLPSLKSKFIGCVLYFETYWGAYFRIIDYKKDGEQTVAAIVSAVKAAALTSLKNVTWI